jgi:adenylate kinase
MIIFIGVAGSGKSVQGRLLADQLNCPYFSVGAFLREHDNKTAQDKMLSGELIQDEDVIKMIEEALDDSGTSSQEFILDGFPRTVKQAEWLISRVNENKLKVTAVFRLVAAEDIIIHRLLDRHRPDDKINVINKRIDEYKDAISPIVNCLRKAGLAIHDIDAEGRVDEVQADIVKAYNLKG